MDIRELVENRRKENNIPEDLKKSSFGIGESIVLIYFFLFLMTFVMSFVTSDDFKLAISKTDNTYAHITEVQEEAVNWKFFNASFTIDSDTFHTTFDASERSPLFDLAVNDSVEIEYSVKNPNVHKVIKLDSGEDFTFMLIPLVFMGLIFFVPILISFIRNRKTIRNRVNIWNNGEIVLAKLSMVKKAKKLIPIFPVLEPKFEVVVDFEFESKAVRTKTIVNNGWLLEQWKQGDTITILVDAQTPEKIIAVEEFVY